MDLPYLDPETWDQDIENLSVLVPAYNDCGAAFRSAVVQYLNVEKTQNAPCTKAGES